MNRHVVVGSVLVILSLALVAAGFNLPSEVVAPAAAAPAAVEPAECAEPATSVEPVPSLPEVPAPILRPCVQTFEGKPLFEGPPWCPPYYKVFDCGDREFVIIQETYEDGCAEVRYWEFKREES